MSELNANVIDAQKALIVVNWLLQTAKHNQKLNDLQSAVFLQTWAKHSYSEIAQQLDYEYDYIKQVGSHLWQSLSQVLGEPVSKHNIQSVLQRMLITPKMNKYTQELDQIRKSEPVPVKLSALQAVAICTHVQLAAQRTGNSKITQIAIIGAKKIQAEVLDPEGTAFEVLEAGWKMIGDY